jgi:hypothetical protein
MPDLAHLQITSDELRITNQAVVVAGLDIPTVHYRVFLVDFIRRMRENAEEAEQDWSAQALQCQTHVADMVGSRK